MRPAQHHDLGRRINAVLPAEREAGEVHLPDVARGGVIDVERARGFEVSIEQQADETRFPDERNRNPSKQVHLAGAFVEASHGAPAFDPVNSAASVELELHRFVQSFDEHLARKAGVIE